MRFPEQRCRSSGLASKRSSAHLNLRVRTEVHYFSSTGFPFPSLSVYGVLRTERLF